jgi:hypothetical protein
VPARHQLRGVSLMDSTAAALQMVRLLNPREASEVIAASGVIDVVVARVAMALTLRAVHPEHSGPRTMPTVNTAKVLQLARLSLMAWWLAIPVDMPTLMLVVKPVKINAPHDEP